MKEILTAAEIEARYDSEWVLVGDPKTNEQFEVQRGKVLWHSKDRDELYRKAIELRPRDFAILYTGHLPEGTEIVLSCAERRRGGPPGDRRRGRVRAWQPRRRSWAEDFAENRRYVSMAVNYDQHENPVLDRLVNHDVGTHPKAAHLLAQVGPQLAHARL
jgi:hypothetical protein